MASVGVAKVERGRDDSWKAKQTLLLVLLPNSDSANNPAPVVILVARLKPFATLVVVVVVACLLDER